MKQNYSENLKHEEPFQYFVPKIKELHELELAGVNNEFTHIVWEKLLHVSSGIFMGIVTHIYFMWIRWKTISHLLKIFWTNCLPVNNLFYYFFGK